ncbi:MAG: hypothetical protein KZQ83_10470 [gamma proteobacterium symbiont of Taylorina sp.]|nr:hypothetical protein [gamma proteobacterium symbiont of Taylorina sp.]
MNQSVPETKSNMNITWFLVVLSTASGIFGVTLFTELGQLLNLPSTWLYAIHPNLTWISILLVIVALYVLYQYFNSKFMSKRLIISYMIVILGCIFITNFFVPYIWLRGHHHTAEFMPVPQADLLMEKS